MHSSSGLTYIRRLFLLYGSIHHSKMLQCLGNFAFYAFSQLHKVQIKWMHRYSKVPVKRRILNEMIAHDKEHIGRTREPVPSIQ